MSRQYTRVGHLFRLMQLIQSRKGLTIRDLADACERHERTIYRDLKTLNDSGVPCGFGKQSKGYRVQPGFFMPPLELKIEEAMAMVALLEQIGESTQILFLDAASIVAEKIRSQLPAAILREIQPLDDCVQIDLARRSADDSVREIYQPMRDAISRRRVLICTYDSIRSADDNAHRSFEFRPYSLWFCQRAWFAVGHHSRRNAIRRLKLNRFISVKLTDQPYEIPPDFDLRADLGNAWRMIRGDTRYHVAVCFEPDFADSASETRWHPTQEEEWDDKGRVTLRFTVDGLEDIVWWVLGYGPKATALGPPELGTVRHRRDNGSAFNGRHPAERLSVYQNT